MSELRRILAAYLRQQADIGAPEYVLSPGLARKLWSVIEQPSPADRSSASRGASPPRRSPPPASAPDPAPRPGAATRRRPIRDLHGSSGAASAARVAQSESPKREQMKQLYFEIRDCAQCPLAHSRHKLVFGAGNVEARVMLIGEAPGADEDQQGLPFVGAAGALLTKMLQAIGLDRNKDVFITNVLKCRPPRNRTPESAERLHCVPILKRQIAIMQPGALLLLGRTAAEALLERTEGIGALRRQTHTVEGIPCFVTYHPAALLRKQEYKRAAWEDLKRFAAALKEMGINGTA